MQYNSRRKQGTRTVGLRNILKHIISKHIIAFFCIAMLLVSQTACTATQLPPYEATYTAKLRGIKIKGLRKFEEIEKDTYKLSWQAKALWMRLDEWSIFKVVDEKVIPLSYHYTRKGLGTDRPIDVYFDWKAMKVTGSKGDDSYEFELEPDTLDKLSFQVQLQLDLLMNKELDSAHYRIAKHNRISDYQFSYVRNEQIETELGVQNTLVFERTKDDGSTILWISPEQNYLPIKIESIEDDKSNVMLIRSWNSRSLQKKQESVAQLDTSEFAEDLPENNDAVFIDDDFE